MIETHRPQCWQLCQMLNSHRCRSPETVLLLPGILYAQLLHHVAEQAAFTEDHHVAFIEQCKNQQRLLAPGYQLVAGLRQLLVKPRQMCSGFCHFPKRSASSSNPLRTLARGWPSSSIKANSIVGAIFCNCCACGP